MHAATLDTNNTTHSETAAPRIADSVATSLRTSSSCFNAALDFDVEVEGNVFSSIDIFVSMSLFMFIKLQRRLHFRRGV
jgi:hypothetical protein